MLNLALLMAYFADVVISLYLMVSFLCCFLSVMLDVGWRSHSLGEAIFFSGSRYVVL